ncbi:hypothetical protein [Streptomyces somaliensis]
MATLTWATVYIPGPESLTSRVTSAVAWKASAPLAVRWPTGESARTSL